MGWTSTRGHDPLPRVDVTHPLSGVLPGSGTSYSVLLYPRESLVEIGGYTGSVRAANENWIKYAEARQLHVPFSLLRHRHH